jgi:hypothetical protein
MTEQTSSGHQTKVGQDRGLISATGGVWAVAGRTTYREEFERDYGPDPDEQVDRTESGREF